MKLKRFAALFAGIAILCCVGCNYDTFMLKDLFPGEATPTEATATDAPTTVTTTEEPTTLKTYDFSQLKYSVNSSALACYDVRENRYLYEKNTLVKISPASLTKIVTAGVALKYADPSAVFTVGDEIKFAKSNSSMCFILKGHQVTLYDLLCGMLMASGNDAAYTVAVNVARSVSGSALNDAEAVGCFVGLMNSYAAEIGLTGSHFVNPEGWDDPEQYMTLQDIVTAALAAMANDTFREIVGKQTYDARFVSGQTITWKNSNLMLDPASPFYLEGVNGIKTGTTEFAKRCLIASYEDADRQLIVASMGNTTDEERYYSVREMIDTVRSQ